MKIVFMGTPKAAVPSLGRMIDDGHDIAAVYTQPDRPAGRGQRLQFSPVKEFAISRGLRILQPAKIKTDEATAACSSLGADVAVVVAYGRILPEPFLTAFPGGAVNVHFSLLPKYRGAAPVNWAIVNGEKKTGVTTMKMDEGLDTGPTLLQAETPIAADETAVELMDRLSMLGASLLSRTIDQIDTLIAHPQDHSDASQAPLLKKSDGQIDWNMDAQSVIDRIRGFQPFPTAFTFLDEKRLTIWSARALETSNTDAVPGTIVDARDDILIAQCGGRSAIGIGELQFEGKRRMSARDFVNGVKRLVGVRLGV